jgi:hypothetical protein
MKTLITKVMGKKVSFKTIENNLQRNWAKKGPIKVVDMADGYFLVYFSCEDDYNHALFEVPWRVADHYLLIQRWSKLFFQEAAMLSKVAVWLRIPKLPLELYNAEFLWRIGSSLGTMLKIDRLTSIHSRGKFARICVELDLDKPLFSHILIRGHKLFLEYEGLHQICFKCGCYGHKSEHCQDKLEPKIQSTINNMSTTTNMDETTTSLEKVTMTEKVETVQQVQLPQERIVKDINGAIPTITEESIKEDSIDASFGPWNIVQRKVRNNTKSSSKIPYHKPKIEGPQSKLVEHVVMGNPSKKLPHDNMKYDKVTRVTPNNSKGSQVVGSTTTNEAHVQQHTRPHENSFDEKPNNKLLPKQPLVQRVRNPLAGKNSQRKQYKEKKSVSTLKPPFIPKEKFIPKPLVDATKANDTPKVDRVGKQDNFQILENIRIMERTLPKDFVFSSLPSDPLADAMVETDAETLTLAEKLKNQRIMHVKSPTTTSPKSNEVGAMDIEEKNLESGLKIDTGTRSQFSPNNH